MPLSDPSGFTKVFSSMPSARCFVYSLLFFSLGASQAPVICNIILRGLRQSITATGTEVKDTVQRKAARTHLENNHSTAYVYLSYNS